MPLLNALVGDLKGLRYRSSLKIYLKNFYHVTSPEAFLSEGTNTFHNLISRCSLRHHNDKNRHRYHHIVIIMIRITITKQRVPFQQIPSWTSLEIRLVINAIYFRLWYCNCTIIGGKGRPGRPDGKYGFLSDPNSIWPNTQLGSNQIAIKSMASDDNDRWVEERPVEIKFIVLVLFFLGGFNFPRAALPPQNL